MLGFKFICFFQIQFNGPNYSQNAVRCAPAHTVENKGVFNVSQVFFENKLSFFWDCHFHGVFLHLQYYLAATNIGTVGIRLAKYKSTWVDKHTSYAIVGVSFKYRRFFMVRYKYSQRSAEVPLSRRIGSSCRSGFRNLPSRYRELHSGFDKSHNTTISAQLVPVSHIIASRSNF